MVVDEANSALTDRELLILLNERLTNLRDEIKYSNEHNQKEIDRINETIEKLDTKFNCAIVDISSTLSMQKGAIILVGFVLPLFVTGLVWYFT